MDSFIRQLNVKILKSSPSKSSWKRKGANSIVQKRYSALTTASHDSLVWTKKDTKNSFNSRSTRNRQQGPTGISRLFAEPSRKDKDSTLEEPYLEGISRLFVEPSCIHKDKDSTLEEPHIDVPISTQTEENFSSLAETLKGFVTEQMEEMETKLWEKINKRFQESEAKILCKLDEIESFVKPQGIQST